MGMSRRGGTGSKKDVLLELVSRDIKEVLLIVYFYKDCLFFGVC